MPYELMDGKSWKIVGKLKKKKTFVLLILFWNTWVREKKIQFLSCRGNERVNDGIQHKFYQKWLSFDNISSKIHCSVWMTFGKIGDSVFVNWVEINLKSIYIKINRHEESNVHNEAASTYLFYTEI